MVGVFIRSNLFFPRNTKWILNTVTTIILEKNLTFRVCPITFKSYISCRKSTVLSNRTLVLCTKSLRRIQNLSPTSRLTDERMNLKFFISLSISCEGDNRKFKTPCSKKSLYFSLLYLFMIKLLFFSGLTFFFFFT